MTLDEAIQRENKIAEENQKIVDTEIVFDDVSRSQLYCDDTEVIEEHLSNYKKCAEYHKKIAEWLEELKSLKNGLNIKCDSLNEALEKGKKIGYNKALDDFIRKCGMESRVILDEIIHLSYYGLSMRELQRIAEQLKEREI